MILVSPERRSTTRVTIAALRRSRKEPIAANNRSRDRGERGCTKGLNVVAVRLRWAVRVKFGGEEGRSVLGDGSR